MTERCSEKAQDLINRLVKSVDVVTDYGDEYELACCGKCQDDLSSYIAALESSVAELTQFSEESKLRLDAATEHFSQKNAEIEALTLQVAELSKERDKAIRGRAHTQQWYANRLYILEHWFRNEGKDLPIANQFWDIIANGTPGADYTPIYAQLLDIERWRADKAEQRAESAEALVREVAATRPYESLVQQLYCSVCGSGPAACFAEINHLESCAWDRCKRNVEEQR